MDEELKEALSRVWHLAERKHQDECYYKECHMCVALQKVAVTFPLEETTRLEAYRNLAG